MTPDESFAYFMRSFNEAGGLAPLVMLRDAWATAILDKWRALNQNARSWSMAEGKDPKGDICVTIDGVDYQEFLGTSPAAARIGAAKHHGTRDERILP